VVGADSDHFFTNALKGSFILDYILLMSVQFVVNGVVALLLNNKSETAQLVAAHKPEEAHFVIVEDDDSVRSAMEMLLNTMGLSCTPFKTAEQVSDEFIQNRVTKLSYTCPKGYSNKTSHFIIDYGLPGKNGVELAQLLLERGVPIQSITIISGQSRVWIVQKHHSARDLHIIQKPFSLVKLVEDLNFRRVENV
jgi:CheY-like chemotaxis protein